MTLRWSLAALHLLGFGIGLGAIWARARELAATGRDAHALQRAMTADNWWGLSALLLIGTGLARLLLGTEKATGFYLTNHVLWAKLGVVGLILALEIAPMVRLIRWRLQAKRAAALDLRAAAWMSRVSFLQAGLLLLALGLAVAMARGVGS